MNNDEIEKEESLAKETMDDCKILYCQKDLPMTKTCMCWGWECGKGWHNAIRKASCRLEALNLLYYDKFKVRIQADQVKEKYGTLRFYYSVICDNYTPEGINAKDVIDKFETLKDTGHFGLKNVVDKEGYTDVEVDDNGKKIEVWHQPISHIEPTKNVEEYEKMKADADAAYDCLAAHGRYDLTSEQKVIMDMMDAEAEKIVREAEDECYSTCEDCGAQIGTKWSPRCMTAGWITYICDRCAEKLDRIYYKNGAKWQGKTCLMTKEEVEAERAKKEAEYGDADDEGDEEE